MVAKESVKVSWLRGVESITGKEWLRQTDTNGWTHSAEIRTQYLPVATRDLLVKAQQNKPTAPSEPRLLLV